MVAPTEAVRVEVPMVPDLMVKTAWPWELVAGETAVMVSDDPREEVRVTLWLVIG